MLAKGRRSNKSGPRHVCAFTNAARQKNTIVCPPSKIDIFKEKNVKQSMFRILFLRGDIPCHRSFNKKPLKDDSNQEKETFLLWKVPPQDLDYSHYLPIFFDGLCDAGYPYSFIARYGIHDLLSVGGDKIRPIVPQLIIPIKNALNTRNSEIILATLRIIQHMCICDSYVAVALVPFYRQILPICNLYCCHNVNVRDAIDYDRVGQLGDVIEETLQLLERCGGKDAFVNIKYSIPTYESCMLDSSCD